MSTQIERPPDAGAKVTPPDGLSASQVETEITTFATADAVLTLASLPVGARLILRCRKDWRVACVSFVTDENVTLSVGSPSGHTYRVRRPANAPLTHDDDNSALPILGEGQWRAGFARYDTRW